MLGVVPLRGTS